MSERASLSQHHRELLLSLAYLGGLTYALALRLLPCYSERTLQRDLADLRKLGDVEKHPLYKPGPQGRPVKVCDVWTLTDRGHEYVATKANDRYPVKPAKLRHKRVQAHDLLVVKAIVALVELARPADLSGLFAQFETRLNPDERRPIPDAVVVMQVGGGFGRTDIVPWTKDPAIGDEHRWRFAIEADNGTETLSVIAGKAQAYKAAFANPEWRSWWIGRFGPLPLIIWIVSNKEGSWEQAADRLLAIHRAWEPVWPIGTWIGTTEQYVEKNIWLGYIQRRMGWGNIQSFERPTAKSAQLPSEVPSTRASNITRSETAAPTAEQAPPRSQLARPVERIATPRTITAAKVVAERVVAETRAPQAGEQALAEHRDVHPWSSTGAATYRTRVDIQGSAASYNRKSASVAPTHITPRAPTQAPIDRDFWDWWGIRWDMVLLEGGAYVLGFCTSPIRAFWKLLRLLKRMITWLLFDVRDSWTFEEVRTFTVVVMLFLTALGGMALIVHQVREELLAAPVISVMPQPVPIVPVPAPPPTTCGTAHVLSDGLNLRAAPGGEVLTVLYRHQEVVLLCEDQHGPSRWLRVRAGQREGWVNAHYLRRVGQGG